MVAARISLGLDPALSTEEYRLSVSAGRVDIQGGGYAGFYTQGDIREILAYAAARFIAIVPEIETPGHV